MSHTTTRLFTCYSVEFLIRPETFVSAVVLILGHTAVQNSRCTYVIGTVLLLSMEYYTFAEYADMMLLYGEARQKRVVEWDIR